jgi:DNA-binding NarL/FixJ family response regulator
MPQPLRLIIVATHAAVSGALARRLDEVLFEGAGQIETLTSLAALAARLEPWQGRLPIVLVDAGLQGFEPAVTIPALRAAHPGLRLIPLLARDDPDEELALVRLGAAAVLSWGAAAGFIGRVLRIVAAGSTFMSAAALLAASPATGDGKPREDAVFPEAAAMPSAPLTERESAILAHIRRGESNRSIGDALGIDENRVKIHLRAIFRKTGARNRTEAALRAAAGALGSAPIELRLAAAG